MIKIVTFIQSAVFLVLSAIHFSWLLGSKWGLNKALPTNLDGVAVLSPTKWDTAIVAIGLLLIATYYIIKGNFLIISIPNWLKNYAGWAISTLFLLRAIGDFNYVGFFKVIATTDFAKLDTAFYTPLCLGLAITGVLLELIIVKKNKEKIF